MTSVPGDVGLLDSLQLSTDVELTVVQMRLLSAAAVDERLPQAVRVSAVSRDVTAELLGVLRGDPDQATNSELLIEMSRQSLAEETAGIYRFHDVVREALLREWHSTPERQSEFEELSQRLVEHYGAKLTEAKALDADFARISAEIRTANPQRWARLKATIDRRISWAVRRAARHGFAIGAESGMAVLRSNIDQLLLDDRLTVVDRLLGEARDQLAGLPDLPEVAEHRAVLRYFSAGLHRRVTGHVTAELEAVLNDQHLPAKYRQWALDDLATAYEADIRFADALRLRQELVDRPAELDEWNSPLWAFSLSLLHWRMLDRAAAVGAMNRSLELAEGDGRRRDMVVRAYAILSQLHADLGHRSAAFAAGFEALDRARTASPFDQSSASLTARTVANLLVSTDGRASEAAWAESLALLPAGAIEQVDVLSERADHLLKVGATARMRELHDQIADLVAAAAKFDGPPAEVPLRRGYAAEATGDYPAALVAFDEAASLSGDGPAMAERWMDSLIGRSRIRRRLCDFDGAESDLNLLRQRFRSAGWVRRDAALGAEFAWIALDRGRLEDCEAQLRTGELLEPGETWERAILHRVTGMLHHARADWEQADQAFEAALRNYDARADDASAAEILGRLSRTAEERSDWPRQNRRVRQLGRRVVQLSRRATAEASRAAIEAADIAGEAMAVLLTATVDQEQTAWLDARALLERARHLDGKCFWYPLNLSYVLAAAADWASARRALERALALAPLDARVPILHERALRYAAEELLAPTDADTVPDSVDTRARAYLEALDDHLRQVDRSISRPFAMTGVLLAALTDRPDAMVSMATAMGRSQAPAMNDRVSVRGVAATLIADPADYWRVCDLLRRVGNQTPRLAANLGAVLDELDGWLADWFGLANDSADLPQPPVSAVRLEVGERLVLFVDNRQDDGYFLFELLPALRDRLVRTTGIELPALRAASEPALGPSQVRILLDDVEVLIAELDADAGGAVAPYAPPQRPGLILPDHPVDGRPGPWVLMPAGPIPPPGEDDRAGTERLTPPLTLIALVEAAVQQHLELFIDVDATRARVAEWRSDAAFADRVTRWVPDATAELALTWPLRRLAAEGAPLLPDAVLAGIELVGGLSAGTEEIVKAVRGALGDKLPGRESSRSVEYVPAELLVAALQPESMVTGEMAAHNLDRWLRDVIAESGPWTTAVVPDGFSRTRVQHLLQLTEPLVAVVSASELSSR